MLTVVSFYNSAGWRRKLIFDIHVVTVLSTEAASDMVRCFTTNNWGTFFILLTWATASSQQDSDQPAEEGQFDGHGFMVNALVGLCQSTSDPPQPLVTWQYTAGVIVFIFGMMVMLVICINNTCIKRYLKARQLVIKAAQYRPAKYKKVSPTTAASIQGK